MMVKKKTKARAKAKTKTRARPKKARAAKPAAPFRVRRDSQGRQTHDSLGRELFRCPELARARSLIADEGQDIWVLVPVPTPAITPEEFEDAVYRSRVNLVQNYYKGVGESLRDLSDFGGVEYVDLYHVKRRVVKNVTFRDGKQVGGTF